MLSRSDTLIHDVYSHHRIDVVCICQLQHNRQPFMETTPVYFNNRDRVSEFVFFSSSVYLHLLSDSQQDPNVTQRGTVKISSLIPKARVNM